MRFSPDSQELWVWHEAWSNAFDRIQIGPSRLLSVWNVPRRALLAERASQNEPYRSTVFTAGGRRYSRYGTELIETHTGSVCKTWKTDQGPMTAWAFSPDMSLMAVACPGGPVFLCDVYGAHTANKKSDDRTLRQLWDALLEADAEKAFATVSVMVQRGDESVRFLQTQLVPTESNSESVMRLIDQLDADEFSVRERAAKELEGASVAFDVLDQALARSQSTEQRSRLQDLIGRRGTFPASPDLMRMLRAVEVLEAIGSPDASDLLAVLSRGADSHQTREAQAALARLGKRIRSSPREQDGPALNPHGSGGTSP